MHSDLLHFCPYRLRFSSLFLSLNPFLMPETSSAVPPSMAKFCFRSIVFNRSLNVFSMSTVTFFPIINPNRIFCYFMHLPCVPWVLLRSQEILTCATWNSCSGWLIHSVTLVRFGFLPFKVLMLLQYFLFPLWVRSPLGILCYRGLVIWVWEQENNLKSQLVPSPRRSGFGVWGLGTEEPLDLPFKLLLKSLFPLLPRWTFLLEKPQELYPALLSRMHPQWIHWLWVGGWRDKRIPRGDHPWCSSCPVQPQSPHIRPCLLLPWLSVWLSFCTDDTGHPMHGKRVRKRKGHSWSWLFPACPLSLATESLSYYFSFKQE